MTEAEAAKAQARGRREEAEAAAPDPLTTARAPPPRLTAATPRRHQDRCRLVVLPIRGEEKRREDKRVERRGGVEKRELTGGSHM